jgi:hypothetical protein
MSAHALQAAKAGDQNLVKQRSAEWYANGTQIADFLHKANRAAGHATRCAG